MILFPRQKKGKKSVKTKKKDSHVATFAQWDLKKKKKKQVHIIYSLFKDENGYFNIRNTLENYNPSTPACLQLVSP